MIYLYVQYFDDFGILMIPVKLILKKLVINKLLCYFYT